jgi:GNAT superfamily N-acetyltransferase
MSKQRPPIHVRAVTPADYDEWRPMWDDYNAFYERVGPTALPEEVTESTWRRFFDANEPVHCVVAERDGKLVGLCHYLYHRSTSRLNPVCYLQDLFTAPDYRGHGIGRALIERVHDIAREAGSTRVYWLTHTTNTPGRTLYDKVAKNLGFIQYVQDVTS